MRSVSTGNKRRERILGDEYDPFQSILSQIRDIEQYPEITRLSKLYESFRIYSEWTFARNSLVTGQKSEGCVTYAKT